VGYGRKIFFIYIDKLIFNFLDMVKIKKRKKEKKELF